MKSGTPEYQRQWRAKNLEHSRKYYREWHYKDYRKKKANMTDEQKKEQRERWRLEQKAYRLRKKRASIRELWRKHEW